MRESEKEETHKCGPPGLDADTGEGLPRGGAGPYGCMAKWNPRGGSGHISLHGALRRCLCTAACGTHRNIDNDIRLSHLRDGSWIPDDTAGKQPGGGGGGENHPPPPTPHPASKELLMPLDNDLGPQQKQQRSRGSLRRKAFTIAGPSPTTRGESHNSTTFHTKSATVVKSISHYL